MLDTSSSHLKSSCTRSRRSVYASSRILRLDNNKLDSLPEGFLKLKLLTVLSLRHNNFSKLPYRFGDLRSLQELDLGENMLKTLPPTTVSMTDRVACRLLVLTDGLRLPVCVKNLSQTFPLVSSCVPKRHRNFYKPVPWYQ